MKNQRLQGELALVTGATGGIGSSIADRLRDDGARVIGCGSRRGPAGFDFGKGCDLSDGHAVAVLAEEVRRDIGDPTIVIHAAAISENKTTVQSSPEAFAQIYNVNVISAVRLVKAFAPAMCERRHGSFIFVSSINSQFAAPGLSAYAASKGALDSLTRTLALELSADGVRVNAVSPASVDTPLLRQKFDFSNDPAGAEAANIARHPLGRLGVPADVANLVSFLVSEEAAWITGSVQLVDGGAHITRR